MFLEGFGRFWGQKVQKSTKMVQKVQNGTQKKYAKNTRIVACNRSHLGLYVGTFGRSEGFFVMEKNGEKYEKMTKTVHCAYRS